MFNENTFANATRNGRAAVRRKQRGRRPDHYEHTNLMRPGETSASASCRLLGARTSGRFSVSEPTSLAYSAIAGERATSKRRERRSPLPTTLGCSQAKPRWRVFKFRLGGVINGRLRVW